MGWAEPAWAWLPVFLFGLTGASPQSNYDLQALSVEYEGAGLPEFGTLNGTVTELGKKLPVIQQVDLSLDLIGSPHIFYHQPLK